MSNSVVISSGNVHITKPVVIDGNLVLGNLLTVTGQTNYSLPDATNLNLISPNSVMLFNSSGTSSFTPVMNIVPSQIHPQRFSISHEYSSVITGNPIIKSITSNNGITYYQQSTSAISDSFQWSCLLDAGQYSLVVWGVKDDTCGNISCTLDNNISVGFASNSWYASTPIYDTSLQSGVTITSPGRHVFKFIADDKDGASSGYNLKLSRFALLPGFVETTRT